CESFTNVVAKDELESDLVGGNIRPTAVQTNGHGRLNVFLRSDTAALTYRLTFSDLSSAATAAHIHGPANDTTTAQILVNFADLPDGGQGTIDLGVNGGALGSIDLRQPVEAGVSGEEFFRLLQTSQLYVDVHTVNFPDGEIRGRISP
ncbi:MAG TPA: CHRD domain-containing protein, partial [Gemmatimonadaceae bacterium]|nr:CHRD domain-containing protein [Gemmatimonadaceae bacterium]